MIDKHSTKVEVLAAIIEEGALTALESASIDMQNDEDVVLAAAQGNGYSLQHASPIIRSTNEKIALAALHSSGVMALQFLYQPVALPALEKHLKNELSVCREMGTGWIQNQIEQLYLIAHSLQDINVKEIMAVVLNVLKNDHEVTNILQLNDTTGDFKDSLKKIKECDDDESTFIATPSA